MLTISIILFVLSSAILLKRDNLFLLKRDTLFLFGRITAITLLFFFLLPSTMIAMRLSLFHIFAINIFLLIVLMAKSLKLIIIYTPSRLVPGVVFYNLTKLINFRLIFPNKLLNSINNNRKVLFDKFVGLIILIISGVLISTGIYLLGQCEEKLPCIIIFILM